MTFSFFLSLEADGFGLVVGDEGVAIEGDLIYYLAGAVAVPDFATDGDFSNGELGPLRRVSREVESERSLVGLMARTFCFIPFRTGDGEGFVASVATEEATRGLTGGREGEGSLLGGFEAEAIAFGSSDDLFFDKLLSWVFTMTLNLNEA